MGEGGSTFTYTSDGALRLKIEGRDAAYLTLRGTGKDIVTVVSDKKKYEGYGDSVLTELDGDQIFARTDLLDDDKLQFAIKSGTGKWKGVSGKIVTIIQYTPTGSETFFSFFFEGEGMLKFPKP